MKEKSATRKDLVKNGAGNINRDVRVFTFFLFLAFVFWYLNSLEKETEAGINYQVKYINLPKNRIIGDKSGDKLNIFIKGKGSSLLKIKLASNRGPVYIDFSKVNYNKISGENKYNYYIVTSGLLKSLSVQLGSGFEVTSIKPDTLFFALENGSRNESSGAAGKISAEDKKENQWIKR